MVPIYDFYDSLSPCYSIRKAALLSFAKRLPEALLSGNRFIEALETGQDEERLKPMVEMAIRCLMHSYSSLEVSAGFFNALDFSFEDQDKAQVDILTEKLAQAELQAVEEKLKRQELEKKGQLRLEQIHSLSGLLKTAQEDVAEVEGKDEVILTLEAEVSSLKEQLKAKNDLRKENAGLKEELKRAEKELEKQKTSTKLRAYSCAASPTNIFLTPTTSKTNWYRQI